MVVALAVVMWRKCCGVCEDVGALGVVEAVVVNGVQFKRGDRVVLVMRLSLRVPVWSGVQACMKEIVCKIK